jgi:hypothetical protein
MACTTCPLTWSFTRTSPTTNIDHVLWDFGDGTSQVVPDSPVAVSHPYAKKGTYVVTMTVTTADSLVVVAKSTVSMGVVTQQDAGDYRLAYDDSFTADMGSTITIGIAELLSNDVPGVTLASTSSRCPLSPDRTYCTITVTGLQTGVRTGSDSFTYSVTDASGRSDVGTTATVNIAITRPLYAALTPSRWRSTRHRTPPTSISPRSSSLRTTQLDAIVQTGRNPDHGQLALLGGTAKGPKFRFTPDSCFDGYATFDYVIGWDANPPTDQSVVSILVKDAAPVPGFQVWCGPTAFDPTASYRKCTVHAQSTDTCMVTRWL